jgi:cardiolipin synthase (CMP-forming)
MVISCASTRSMPIIMHNILWKCKCNRFQKLWYIFKMDIIHMTGRVADWDAVPHSNRNRWQRLAARSSGWVTPGNVVSMAGAVTASIGLMWLYQGKLVSGLIAVVLGRICDILDGYAAHYTGTKSSLGELVDAGLDKIIMLLAFIVFAATSLIPFWLLLLLGIQQLVAAMLGGYGKLKHAGLHPSRFGKYAAIGQWTAILLYVLFAALGGISGGIMTVLHVLFLATILTGYAATYGYAAFVYGTSVPKTKKRL